jgi:dTDP-4-amino-4,6-dideoxygalactose transaminase
MNIPFVNLKSQYLSIKEEIDRAIKSVIDNNAFILGNYVEEFEKNFAKFCGAKYAVGVNSGTAALYLALLAHGIGKDDEVITAPNSFFATAGAISQTGAKPVFVDINEDNYNIDASKIEKAITNKTKAIMPVHLYGQTADMGAIQKIAEKYNLIVIEDCCQAHGAEYNGKRTPVGDIGCFSFYPAKNLGAFGEGGAIVMNNEEIANKIRLLRAHGESPKNTHLSIGYNYRMEGLQGAILNVKLKHLEEWNRARRKNAVLYNELLKGKVITPKDNLGHAYHLYVIMHKERDALQEYLNSKGIMAGIHYPKPIHLQPAYAHLGYKEGDFPVAEKCAKEILSLPMCPELSEEEINYVADAINAFVSSKKTKI